MPERARLLSWERRWALPAGLASLAAVALVVASIVLATQIGGADGDARFLLNVDEQRGTRLLAGILQAVGVALLAAPLLLLFRAAAARSEAVRGQLVGVVIAGPLFLAAASVLSAVASLQAATEFVAEQVPALAAEGVALDGGRADRLASDAIGGADLRPLAAGFGIGGQLGFLVGMLYTAMQAMRVGLLTRFWGSLGMALGAVSFILFQFALLWYVYVGLLLAGWLPGGRPPAWAAGEAIPWPTPGERIAGTEDEPERRD